MFGRLVEKAVLIFNQKINWRAKIIFHSFHFYHLPDAG